MNELEMLPLFQQAFREIGNLVRFPTGYNKTPPSSGCCFVTAAVVQRLCGGRILVCRREHSFINEIDGQRFDLTSDQYGLVPPQVNLKWKYVEYSRKPRTKRVHLLETYIRKRLQLQLDIADAAGWKV